MTSKQSLPKTNRASYESATVTPLDGSRVEIIGVISSSEWEKYRPQALKSLNETVTIDGFRKGNVPENILVAKVGEAAILEEMAESALSRAYVEIAIDHKIDAIGKPHIQVTKLAKGNPLEFKAVTAVVPEIKLPDYRALAATAIKQASPKDIEVTDKDIDDAIVRVRKAHVSHEGHDHAKMTPEEHEKSIMDSLPEFNDEFVRGLGSDFTDVEDFKKKVRLMIGENKKDEAKEKTRLGIADALTDATKIGLPDVMIESELNRTQAQFEQDIERMGVKLEDYLKHAKKSLEDIRAEWRPHAEKKAKLQLILNAIATKENIKPDQAEIDAEVSHIVSHYKDTDRERAATYAETILTNEKVFQFLEKSEK
ncbi:MAG: hypothetical protein KGI59_02320 [Patescibacteria group bacterium]|nr:hypothetical protein [Patescibacteria group bacterium]MDE2172839.1 hypothetical protein [Patescibacteria group bacterium]